MRHFKLSILAFLFTSFAMIPSAFAVSSQAAPARVVCSTTNITATTWVPLVSNTAQAVKGILIYSTANVAAAYGDLAIGIAATTATANTEVAQVYIQSSSTGSPIYIPMTAGAATRISVKALDATQVLGEVVADIIYN